MRRVLTAAITAAAFIAAPSVANATEYYVSPGGSDSNNGTSLSTPWRTVSKVNSSAVQNALQPGDVVNFTAGSTFSDAALTPTKSGTAAARIVYRETKPNFTGETAFLPRGIRFTNGVDGLYFQRFSINGSTYGLTHGVLANTNASDDITFDDLDIRNVSIGIQSNVQANQRWDILNSTIDETGDSGMILLGNGFDIYDNTITDIGKNTSIGYGKHGIYLKVSNADVQRNTILRGANGQAVSPRFRGSRIQNNELRGHPHAIGYFECDSLAGTSNWSNNTMQSIGTGIYVSGSDGACGPKSTNETFYIDGNSIDHGNQCMNLVNNGIAVYHVGTVAPNTCF